MFFGAKCVCMCVYVCGGKSDLTLKSKSGGFDKKGKPKGRYLPN